MALVKGEQAYASLNAENYRNISAYIQHAPKTVDNYIFDPNFKSEIAIQNLVGLRLSIDGFPCFVFQATKTIPKGTMLTWDYGQDYWKVFKEIPYLFTPTGEIIDRSYYQVREIRLNLILDKKIIQLLSSGLRYSLTCAFPVAYLSKVEDCIFVVLDEKLNEQNDVMVKVMVNDILEGHQKCPQNGELDVPGILTKDIDDWDKEYLKQVQDAIHLSSALCQKCGEKSKTFQKLFSCSRCKVVFYCNKNCQKDNWPEHKKNCKSAI